MLWFYLKNAKGLGWKDHRGWRKDHLGWQRPSGMAKSAFAKGEINNICYKNVLELVDEIIKVNGMLK